MKLPIQYALFYPERRSMQGKRVDFFELAQMTFERVDTDTFAGFSHAMYAAKRGGSMPTVFNAANEKAVALFLAGRIGFTDIPKLIRAAMDAHTVVDTPSVTQILNAEAEAYEYIKATIGDSKNQ